MKSLMQEGRTEDLEESEQKVSPSFRRRRLLWAEMGDGTPAGENEPSERLGSLERGQEGQKPVMRQQGGREGTEGGSWCTSAPALKQPKCSQALWETESSPMERYGE